MSSDEETGERSEDGDVQNAKEGGQEVRVLSPLPILEQHAVCVLIQKQLADLTETRIFIEQCASAGVSSAKYAPHQYELRPLFRFSAATRPIPCKTKIAL